MKIGIPKEIKNREGRVSLTPAGAVQLRAHGHDVCVERSAGIGSGFADEEYIRAGAEIISTADEVWETAEMIIKVKEPVEPEFDRMKEGQVLFTYLHLAADEELTKKLLARKVIGIAYETIQPADGSLPLLAPMSEVAGRLSVQMGCSCLEAAKGGRGLLLSGVPGVAPANVVIIGGGISGINAAHLAVGMGARVTILDVNIDRLRYLEDVFHSRAVTLMSNRTNIKESVAEADLVIGAVLIPGARAPRIISRDIVSKMKKGSAFVDIAIDQGGCADTSRPTSHDNPVYIEEGVVHYCVTNMPGAVPRTSTFALTNATLPFAIELADKGYERALAENPALAGGLNVCGGSLANPRVAEAFGMDCAKMAFSSVN
ncbi:MAG TPA: alanine dehydrogenase [Spirochaetes bacterium]|nr:alanine dehydrogenase [Spirochaetota bacterium]